MESYPEGTDIRSNDPWAGRPKENRNHTPTALLRTKLDRIEHMFCRYCKNDQDCDHAERFPGLLAVDILLLQAGPANFYKKKCATGSVRRHSLR